VAGHSKVRVWGQGKVSLSIASEGGPRPDLANKVFLCKDQGGGDKSGKKKTDQVLPREKCKTTSGVLLKRQKGSKDFPVRRNLVGLKLEGSAAKGKLTLEALWEEMFWTRQPRKNLGRGNYNIEPKVYTGHRICFLY